MRSERNSKLQLASREKMCRLSISPIDGGAPGEVRVWIENLPGAGEDAWPVWCFEPANRIGLVGVADGLGASGSRRIGDGDVERTGAQIAAYIASAALEQTFLDCTTLREEPTEICTSSLNSAANGTEVGFAAFVSALEARLSDEFRIAIDRLRLPVGSALKGKALRFLPTTLASIVYKTTKEGDQTDLTAVWLGDSRCYAWMPSGLVQISVDDLRQDVDAMDAVRADAQLSRYISETGTPNLNRKQLRLRGPVMLIAASDGAYGYFRTPMHVEHALVSAAASASDEEHFADLLTQAIGERAADDVSLSIATIGWLSWSDIRADAKRRLEVLEKDFIASLRQFDEMIEGKSAEIALIVQKKGEIEGNVASYKQQRDLAERAIWGKFREHYEQYIRGEEQAI